MADNGFEKSMERGRLLKKKFRYTRDNVNLMRAIVCFEKAIELSPLDAEAHYQYADCRMELGGWRSVQKARDKYEGFLGSIGANKHEYRKAILYASLLARGLENKHDYNAMKIFLKMMLEYADIYEKVYPEEYEDIREDVDEAKTKFNEAKRMIMTRQATPTPIR